MTKDWREITDRPAGFSQELEIGLEKYRFRWIPAGEFDMGSPKSEQL